MTIGALIKAGWRLTLVPDPSDFLTRRYGKGAFGYIGHHGQCYIEGTASSYADLERKLTQAHENGVTNGVVVPR